jgi:protein-disulfide isomerase
LETKQMNKGTAIVGMFMCFLAGMFLMWGIDRAKGPRIEAETVSAAGTVDHSASPVPVTADDPTWGNADAPVTIVEISDYECPFCSRVGPTIKRLKEEYGADKLRLVFKHNPLPFHKAARPAHEAAATVFAIAGADAFWKFHALVFQNQRALTEENIAKWVAESGVDPAKFKAAYDAKKYAAKVDKDMALAQKIGASGTPAFRINGVTLSGAQPYEKFKEVVDQQLAEAKKAIAAGTKAGDVYVELSKKNATLAPEKPQKPAEPQEDLTVWKAPVFDDDPIKGKKDALVTIVVFSEFQCPFCKKVDDTLKQVTAKYGDDVRIVWKDNILPFHPRAKPAAILARVAYKQKGDQGFWAVHDDLFATQARLEEDDLKGVADKNGIAWAGVQAAFQANRYADKFEQSSDLAMDLNARGTPHFFINGRRLQGAQPFEKFQALIDEQLGKARAVIARGVPRAKVYEEIMKEGKEPPPPERKNVAAPPPDAPFKGAANAKVVIHEFSEFECPFCKRVGPTLEELEKAYPGKIKIVWRHMPLAFHKNAQLASEAAQEAYAQKGNTGFWKYHDELFGAQGTPGGLERPNLEAIAEKLGLDMTKFRQALDSGKHTARVKKDAEAAQNAGISGTPAFVINGYFLSGAQPPAAFKKLVNKALKE